MARRWIYFTLTCAECGSAFVYARVGRGGAPPSWCTPCQKKRLHQQVKNWRSQPANREKINARQREYLASNPERETLRYETANAKKYGLSLERYREIAYGECAICGEKCATRDRLAIDHDHECCPDPGRSCGRCVRGGLCMRCNLLIGHMESAGPLVVVQAAQYIAHHTKNQ
jgi:hypothetical protein